MCAYKRQIRSDEAIVKLLDKLVSEITDIKKQGNETLEIVKKQTPKGIIIPLSIKTANTTPQTIRFTVPYFSINVVNDGPDDCLMVINTEKSSTTPFLLKSGSVEEIDLKSAKINDIYYYTESGTAELRIRGIR